MEPGSGQGSAESSQPPRKQRIPLANWPSIKILQPPKGMYSPRPDERCITYCSQSIAGRVAQRDPWCRSICIRKVFSHEVRDLTGKGQARSAQAQQDALHPLPPEGQRSHDMLGGLLGEKEEVDGGRGGDVKHWEEGWYMWYGKNLGAARERLDLMSYSLLRQSRWLQTKEQRKREWEEWQQRKHRGRREGEESLAGEEQGHKSTEPPRPYPDASAEALLLRIPPSFPPIYDQVQTFLAPTYQVLNIFRESLESGGQREFAGRVWEKAWTREPIQLAGAVCSMMWEKWNQRPPDDTESTEE